MDLHTSGNSEIKALFARDSNKGDSSPQNEDNDTALFATPKPEALLKRIIEPLSIFDLLSTKLDLLRVILGSTKYLLYFKQISLL